MCVRLAFVQLGEAVSEIGEVVTDTSVTGECKEGIRVADRGHGTQTCLPSLLVPVNKVQLRPQPEIIIIWCKK